jgi:hypothetical protein
MRVGSFEEWWTIVPALAGPVAALLASLPDDVTSAIRDSAETALQPFAGADGYTIPGLSLIGVGHQRSMSAP